MARGITENDVWTASDALLLEGARPTIERVRQKIGRGSPNTVSPYLDTWFKNLGTRIKDPGAFSAPPDVPDQIVHVAKQLWAMAQTESRLDFDQRLKEGMAAAIANVEAEKDRATLAEAAAFEAASKVAHLQSELAERSQFLDDERLGRTAADARLIEAHQQIESLQVRIDRTEREVAEVRASAGQEIASAVERAAASERRTALLLDAERVDRAKAERRVEALERKIEAAATEARDALALSVRNATEKRAECERLANQLATAASSEAKLTDEIVRVTGLLGTEQRAAEHARGEASVARSLLLQFDVRRRTTKSNRKSV